MTHPSDFPENEKKNTENGTSLTLGVVCMLAMVSAFMLLLMGFHAITDKMVGR